MTAVRYNNEAWGLVPARAGSKSIPGKNLVEVGGFPLLDYVVRAAQASRALPRVIGSTDGPAIAKRMTELGIVVDQRPAELAGDDSPVADVARELLERLADRGEALPEIIVLLQPTSPFLLPTHVRDLVGALRADPAIASGQTIITCPHNLHAWNQRWHRDGKVGFIFEAERRAAYNKQRKGRNYLFGNLVATRAAGILAGNGFFAMPSVGIEIPRIFGFDLDDGEDLTLARALLDSRAVQLPHMHETA